MRRTLFLYVLLLTASPAHADETLPAAMQAAAEELGRLDIQPECHALPDERALCRYWLRVPSSASDFRVEARYLPQTDTIYIFVDEYLQAPPGAPTTPAVLQRLMELNWRLLAPRLEWDPRTGEVRMSTLLHTDATFDRKAFRSLVRALDLAANRYHGELRELARSGS